VRRLDDRLVKVERELAVQAWYVRGAFAMVAAIFLRVYWEPVARTLKLLS
jgi:hypothetical protein